MHFSFVPVSLDSSFLLMSVVSAHSAAPSQLDVAQPLQTSSQSNEQSIAAVLCLSKQLSPNCVQATAQHYSDSNKQRMTVDCESC